MKKATLTIVLMAVAAPLFGASSSVYSRRLEDPQATYLTADRFPVQADGKGDDSVAMQRAIDRVQETTGQGILFIPSGQYRLTRTLFVWPGIRLIGYGPTRPVFVLADDTPGFQTGPAYMVFFAGFRPGTLSPRFEKLFANRFPNGQPPPTPGTVPPSFVPDANPGTFYSAISNIDFEIGKGDAGAVAVRFHSAQHCFLAHMDFRLGSALAALYDVGNASEDLRFYGGQYGIITSRPSPGWQFTLIDSSFDGQQNAAIKEHEAGLTLIHDTFSNVPKAIDIEAGHPDELWAKGLRLENITGAAITISEEHNANTEINLEDVLCDHVPVFAHFRQSGSEELSKGNIYEVRLFSHGLTMRRLGAQASITTNYVASALKTMPPPLSPAIRTLPTQDSWVNLKSLGAKGDGKTDDTAAIQKAIDEHEVIYAPSGDYIVSNTIALRPHTVLIGLHPSATQFDILDSTPAFQGPGAPKPLLEAPPGGDNIVTGIGVYAGGINSRAVGALWMAGKDSMIDDVRFLGGHGTYFPDHELVNPYNNDHTADPDLQRRWDAQYPSLWVTDGGGGTFADIWTPDTFAQAGLYISDTTTPGHVYQLSSEHHVRNEVKLNRVSNWELFAVQTEEERGESPFALPLEINRCHDITIANYFGYRVISSYQPFPYAVHVSESSDIRFRNIHIYSNSKVPFDNSIFDQTYRFEVRPLEFAWLDISGEPPEQSRPALAPVVAPRAKLTKLAAGFFNISGAAVDPSGDLYFVDAHLKRIYRWSPKTQEAVIVCDTPLEPVNLAFDKSGDLMVSSYAGKGTVYWFRPGTPEFDVYFLNPEAAITRSNMTAFVASDYWKFSIDTTGTIAGKKPYQYVSPDHTTFIPAGDDFVSGEMAWGTKRGDVITSYGLQSAIPGQRIYVTDSYQEKTYSALVGPDGSLSDVKLFAEQGGTSVAQDNDGNVYIAAGQVLVYDKSGKQIGTIDVPERPIDLIFGGSDQRTLFILSRHSLFCIAILRKP